MLLLAHTGRADIPESLAKDLAYVLEKTPGLVAEMFNLSVQLPSMRGQAGYGWLTPALGCVEMMQCIVQAVPFAAKKPGGGKGGGGGGGADGALALSQLPHLSGDRLRRMQAKKQRVKTLAGGWGQGPRGEGGAAGGEAGRASRDARRSWRGVSARCCCSHACAPLSCPPALRSLSVAPPRPRPNHLDPPTNRAPGAGGGGAARDPDRRGALPARAGRC